MGERTETDNLPDGVELFAYQVAGHKHGKGRLGLGILKGKNGQILKPLFEDAGRAVKELSFYESVFQNCNSEPLLEELKEFLPTFYGTRIIPISGKDIKYLCIEDACGSLKNPSLLDVKIGRITYEDGASEAKMIEQKAKFPHGVACGIRIVGMKVYDEEKGIHVVPEKPYLRELTPDTIATALNLYLTKDRCINAVMLCGFIHKLSQLEHWFSRQRKLKFIGSSLLFAYEGTLSFWRDWMKKIDLDISLYNLQNSNDFKASKLCSNSSGEDALNYEKTKMKEKCFVCGIDKYTCTKVLTKCDLFRVVMIDFAHVSSCEKEDTNYLFGLRKLLSHLKGLLAVQLSDS